MKTCQENKFTEVSTNDEINLMQTIPRRHMEQKNKWVGVINRFQYILIYEMFDSYGNNYIHMKTKKNQVM